MQIRNIAIIAHVDHGKTTLTDALLRQTGDFSEGESMDTNALEQERGITIYAKNSSTTYKGTKINIVDTPGHADFGSEVERVLKAIDCVLLVVDAQEGPMPQTRFVLKKSLELGLKPIVVINKIDKPAADPGRTEVQVLELFLELGATNEQASFPVVYSIGRQGIAKKKLTDDPPAGGWDLTPLLETILEHVPAATDRSGEALLAQPFNLAYDNFLGRMALVRVYSGTLKTGDTVFALSDDRPARQRKITKMFSFHGMARDEVKEVVSGDIALIAGIADIDIGETLASTPDAAPLPAIRVDEPTIVLNFLVNNSPFAGREGKFVTSRQIRERLERELQVNVGLKVDFESSEFFKVFGRGEMHISILLETMRREGFELQVSQPQVIIKEDVGPDGKPTGVKLEPFEEITIDVPSEFQGVVIEKLGKRAAIMSDMRLHGASARLIFEGPTRGLLGYRGDFVVDTKGEGIMASRVVGFKPWAGKIEKRAAGSMISMATGKALAFSLWNLQDRGQLYVAPTTEIYEGMVVGDTSKGEEMVVNPTKGKQLTNMRASGSDEGIFLVPALTVTIERGLEIMADDEYLEITPGSVRLRKRELTETDRSRAKRS